VLTRVNVGCGSTPTPGWVNIDNSPSLVFGRAPENVLTALMRLGVLNEAQLNVARTARQFGILRGNATNLPLAKNSVDVIYSSHMLEHLDREQARAFLAEAFRVLRPGGWIRTVVPDLERYVRDYEAGGSADELIDRLRLATPSEGRRGRFITLVVGFRGHRWMYDSRSLTHLLASSGFTEVSVLDPGVTHISDVGELDLHERDDESIYCEARKPL
jgi:SAM-dependent methyltransferase